MTPAADADRIAELEEQVAQLTALLVPPDMPTPDDWGLTRRERRVYAHLASRPIATFEGVLFAIGEGRALENQNVNVALCNLRKKLPAGYRIVNIWGVGWRLEKPEE